MIEACRNRHLPIVKLLVSRGSSVGHLDRVRASPCYRTYAVDPCTTGMLNSCAGLTDRSLTYYDWV